MSTNTKKKVWCEKKIEFLIEFANKNLRQAHVPDGFVANQPDPLVVTAQKPIDAFARALWSVEPVIVENKDAAHFEFAKRQHGVFQRAFWLVVSVNVNKVEEVVLLWDFLV